MAYSQKPSGADEKSAAAKAGLDLARQLLSDSKYVSHLGNKRGQFLLLVASLEKTLRQYDEEAGILNKHSNIVPVVLGAAAVTKNPYVIMVGLFAIALSAPPLMQTIKHAQTQRALDAATRKMRNFIKAVGAPTVLKVTTPAAITAAITAMLAAYELQQIFPLTRAATLAGLLGITNPDQIATASVRALTTIRSAIAALLGTGGPPHCADLEKIYKASLRLANNSVFPGTYGVNKTFRWSDFLKAAADLVKCLKGPGGPGSPSPA